MSDNIVDLALIVNSNSFGGTERHTIDFLSKINSSTVKSVFLYAGEGFTGHLRKQSLSINASKIDSKVQHLNLNDLKTWNNVFKVQKAKRAAIIKPSFYSIDLKFLFLLRLHYKNLVVIEHSLPPKRLRLQKFGFIPKIGFWRMKDELKRFLYAKLVDKVVTVSELSKTELEKNTFYKDVKACGNGINLDYWIPNIKKGIDFRAKYGIDRNLHLLGCVGNLFTVKSFDIAIHALSLLSKKYKARCALCIVGVGPEERNLREIASRLDVDNVFFVGKQLDMVSVYSAMQTLLITSKSESASLSLLEATACDCSILASNVGICAEVIKEVGNGEIVQSHEPETWAKAIEVHLDGNAFPADSLHLSSKLVLQKKYDNRKTMDRLLNTIMSDG